MNEYVEQDNLLTSCCFFSFFNHNNPDIFLFIGTLHGSIVVVEGFSGRIICVAKNIVNSAINSICIFKNKFLVGTKNAAMLVWDYNLVYSLQELLKTLS